MLKEEKQTRQKFNFLKKYYDETWDPKKQTLHVGIFNDEKQNLFQSYQNATNYLINGLNEISELNENSNILDVGCGTGRTLIAICEKYKCKGIGIDISDAQIKAAKDFLTKKNSKKSNKIKISFIRGSGSELDKIFRKDEQFTHIISQDAIFLVVNKKSLFENLHKLLVPGGAIAIADFLSEKSANEFTKTEKKLIYKLVNWNEGLSFISYQDILKAIGFVEIKSEQRNGDMIKTYSVLSDNLKKYLEKDDKTYKELYERYENIASAVKTEKMGWGIFFAKKQPIKRVLLAGTKEKSIGRFIGNELQKNGWEIWLYGLHAKKIDKKLWHERSCDISSEKNIKKLLNEIPDLDLVMFLADTAPKGILEEISEKKIKDGIDSKLVGTVLLNKALFRYSIRKQPMKLVWLAGKPFSKPKNLIMYTMINSGLAAYIDDINTHYKNIFQAYYIPTTLISPSTLGDDYIEYMRQKGENIKHTAENPKTILEKVLLILDDKVSPGMLKTDKEIL